MSRENKFTPGPWSIFGADNGLGIAVFSEKNCVAHTRDGSTGYDTWKANANLIAAAPELLEALEVLLESFDDDYMWSKDKQDKIDNAKAVIAKAYGEEK